MSIKVHLYSSLQNYTDNQSLVEVNGGTIGQCLADLVRQFPRLKSPLFDKAGKLLSTVFVSINLNSANSEQSERTVGEKDELYIVLIIGGG